MYDASLKRGCTTRSEILCFSLEDVAYSESGPERSTRVRMSDSSATVEEGTTWMVVGVSVTNTLRVVSTYDSAEPRIELANTTVPTTADPNAPTAKDALRRIFR